MGDHGSKVAGVGAMWQKVELAPTAVVDGGRGNTEAEGPVSGSGKLSLEPPGAWVELEASVTPWGGAKGAGVFRPGSPDLPLQETLHRCDRVKVTGRGPLAELGHVNAAVASLAVVDPALGLLETLAECSLGQRRLLSNGAEELGHTAVGWGVLGLGGHLTEFPCQSP